MSIILLDSFDNYNSVTSMYSGGTSSNDLTGTKSRTGIGALQSGTAGSCFYSIPHKVTLIAGIAVLPSNPPGGSLLTFLINGVGNVSSVIQVQLYITNTFGVGVRTSNLPFQTVLGESIPNLFFSGVYAYVEILTTCNPVSGSAIVRVNGATVLNLTNVNTSPGGGPYFDTVQINGPAGGLICYFDDFYLFDNSGGVNNTFAGAVRIYDALPVSDNSPLQWATSTGLTHFNLVNGVPAESQATYVFTGTPGNVDQYLYNVSALPANVTILGVQHSLYTELDTAGSGSIGSECGGILQGSTAVTVTPHIYTFPRDTDPVVSGAWTLANLINRQFGPNRTA